MVYVFLADGFEEIEALCPVDIMRRAGIEVRTTAIGTQREVRGAHNITVSADMLFSELHIEGTPELLMLPGGMPGATHLREHDGLCTLLKTASAAGSRLAAICAAPFILGELGLLEGREATCYPGFEERLFGAKVSPKGVVTDGNITTATGMGVATRFGLELVRLLRGAEAADRIASGIRFGV